MKVLTFLLFIFISLNIKSQTSTIFKPITKLFTITKTRNPIPAINIKRTWNAEREGEKPADSKETTSYGHNTEPVGLMVCALDAANESK